MHCGVSAPPLEPGNGRGRRGRLPSSARPQAGGRAAADRVERPAAGRRRSRRDRARGTRPAPGCRPRSRTARQTGTHGHPREPPRGTAPDPPARRPRAARAPRDRHGARRGRREVPDLLAGLGPARRRRVRGRPRRRVVRLRPYRLPPRPRLAAPQRLEGPRPGAVGARAEPRLPARPARPRPRRAVRSASRRSTSAARRSCGTPRRPRPTRWADCTEPTPESPDHEPKDRGPIGRSICPQRDRTPGD